MRTLVVYGVGSARAHRIAREIAAIFEERGHSIHTGCVRDGGAWPSPVHFDVAIVISSPNWVGEDADIERWIRQNVEVLVHKPTAFFSTGLALIARFASRRLLASVGWKPGTVAHIGDRMHLTVFAEELADTLDAIEKMHRRAASLVSGLFPRHGQPRP
jgi:menaquinone-dependent protoporphyrinogen IX oxidase